MNRQEWNREYYAAHKYYYKAYALKNKLRIKEYRASIAAQMKAYTKNWRLANPDKRKRSDKAFKQRKRLFFWNLKRNPCTDCGIVYHPVSMDFDHLPQYKKLSNNGFTAMSKTRILAEIKKCELVCANCHRVRTWRRGTSPI